MSFDLAISPHLSYCDIFLTTDPGSLSTCQYAHTLNFFARELKSILCSQCYNQDDLPFAQEICNTEIGHLVEHVLLEYLCEEKIKLGYSQAEYSGRTDWNWLVNPRGTFRIRIKISPDESDIFARALQQTVDLFKKFPNHKQAD